jgi:hypothetical protein
VRDVRSGLAAELTPTRAARGACGETSELSPQRWLHFELLNQTAELLGDGGEFAARRLGL